MRKDLYRNLSQKFLGNTNIGSHDDGSKMFIPKTEKADTLLWRRSFREIPSEGFLLGWDQWEEEKTSSDPHPIGPLIF